MKAYTDNFTVRPDGIYRIEEIYHPGGEWEHREVLWISREALETALRKWGGENEPIKTGTAEDGKGT